MKVLQKSRWIRFLVTALLVPILSSCEEEDPVGPGGPADPVVTAPPFRCMEQGPESWLSYSYDGKHSRCYGGPTTISKASVGRLTRAWNVSGLHGVTTTPVVEQGRVWIGDWQGRLHVLDLETGAPVRPAVQLDTSQINATPLLTRDHVYVAGKTKLYRLKRPELSVDWSLKLDDDPYLELDSSPVLAVKDGIIVIGVASHELGLIKEDYTFRGSVVGIDAETGTELWRIYTTSNDATAGAGVSVWSSAAIDEERGLAWIGTGQTYEEPASPMSDSLLCINYRTGELVWTHQFTQGDVWSMARVWGPDFDIGASPHLFTLEGRDMVAVGSKGGIYKVLDRVTGEVIWERLIGRGSPLGGVMASGAVSAGVLYAASNNMGMTETHARDMATGATIWSTTITGNTFGTLVAVGGVLLQSTTLGGVYGLDAETGQILFEYQLEGSPGGGFSVAGDTVLIGYGWTYNGPPLDPEAGGLTALRLAPAAAGNTAPVFLKSRIDGGRAVVDEVWRGSLAADAMDANGDALTFFRQDGPSWLKVSPDGTLEGTPAKEDAGLNRWVMEVSDGALTATAILEIRVVASGGGLPELSPDVAQVLLSRGCATCHGPTAPLNLADWPFTYAPEAVGRTDDPVQILDRIVAITAVDAVPRMPPGAPLPATEHEILSAFRDRVKEAME